MHFSDRTGLEHDIVELALITWSLLFYLAALIIWCLKDTSKK